MEVLRPKAYLKQFAFNPVAEADRFNQLTPTQRILELNQQVESHKNHVRNDKAVSILYKYWMDQNGEVYSSNDTGEINNVKNQIDFRERNGLFYEGLLLAADLAKRNRNQLIVLYSPAGKKLFDDTPLGTTDPEELAVLQRPYDLGQLYFLYYDGNKINNVAVSIDRDDNPWLIELSSDFKDINSIDNEESRIQAFLTNPRLIGDRGNFFSKVWPDNYPIFENINGEKFFLDDVLQSMQFAFADETKSEITLDDETVRAMYKEKVTPEDVSRAYLLPIYQDAHTLQSGAINRNNVIRFGGGCAGTETTTSELEAILGISSALPKTHEQLISTSTAFRNIRQYRQNFDENEDESDEKGPLEFECDECGQRHKRKPHTIMKVCPVLDVEMKKC